MLDFEIANLEFVREEGMRTCERQRENEHGEAETFFDIMQERCRTVGRGGTRAEAEERKHDSSVNTVSRRLGGREGLSCWMIMPAKGSARAVAFRLPAARVDWPASGRARAQGAQAAGTDRRRSGKTAWPEARLVPARCPAQAKPWCSRLCSSSANVSAAYCRPAVRQRPHGCR